MGKARSKRRRTLPGEVLEGLGQKPAQAPAAPPREAGAGAKAVVVPEVTVTAASASSAGVAKELATLAATSAAHPRFATAYSFLLPALGEKDAAGWWNVGPQLPPGDAPTLIALDVEMLVRVADERRFPIRASVLRLRWGEPVESLFSGYLEPEAEGWDEEEGPTPAFDWKSDIHGITRQVLIDARQRGELRALSTVQAAISSALTSLSFLVGHSVDFDFAALKLRGPCLRRMVIDTALVFSEDGGWLVSLKTLVETRLAGSARWAKFQSGHHDPAEDAEAALCLVEREVRLLLADAQRLPGGGRGPAVGELRLGVPVGSAGKVIGSGGATIKGIRGLAGGALELEQRKAGQAVRLVMIQGTEAQARCAEALVREASEQTAFVVQAFTPRAVAEPLPLQAPAAAPEAGQGGAGGAREAEAAVGAAAAGAEAAPAAEGEGPPKGRAAAAEGQTAAEEALGEAAAASEGAPAREEPAQEAGAPEAEAEGEADPQLGRRKKRKRR